MVAVKARRPIMVEGDFENIEIFNKVLSKPTDRRGFHHDIRAKIVPPAP